MGRCAGGFAEYALMDAREAMRVPGGLAWDEAAATPLVFLVVYDMLVAQGHLRAGQWLLVTGDRELPRRTWPVAGSTWTTRSTPCVLGCCGPMLTVSRLPLRWYSSLVPTGISIAHGTPRIRGIRRSAAPTSAVQVRPISVTYQARGCSRLVLILAWLSWWLVASV